MWPHRKRVKSFNIPGDAHELTFSCYRRLPLLSRDRSCGWFAVAMEPAHLLLFASVIIEMDPLPRLVT